MFSMIHCSSKRTNNNNHKLTTPLHNGKVDIENDDKLTKECLTISLQKILFYNQQ